MMTAVKFEQWQFSSRRNCFLNWPSRFQNIEAQFLITYIFRAKLYKNALKNPSDYMIRDFLNPSYFYSLISAFLAPLSVNVAVDSYSREPIDKPTLLAAMLEELGFRYEITDATDGIQETGKISHCNPPNIHATDFGYQPALTSLQRIKQEMEEVLVEVERGRISMDYTGGRL